MQERWITDWPVSERWPHYTRANAGEVLPEPASPLGQQFSWERGMIPGWRDSYVQSGNYSLTEMTRVCQLLSQNDIVEEKLQREQLKMLG